MTDLDLDLDLAAIRERARRHAELTFQWREVGHLPGLSSAATGLAVARAEGELAGDVGVLLAVLDAIRAAAPDPGLLRWCTWPDCWQHFNAVTGPVGDRKWVWACRQHALLCPKHREAGHTPDFDYNSTLLTVTAHCECGDGEVVVPGSIQDVLAWWEKHIRDDVTSHTSTGV